MPGHQELAFDGAEFDDEITSEFSGSDREDTVDEFTSLPRARTNVEAIMGLLAAFFIGLPAPLVATVAVIHLPILNLKILQVLSVMTFFATGYLCLMVIRIGSRAIEGDRNGNSFSLSKDESVTQSNQRDHGEIYIPLALAMAIRLPDWWWTPLRPFVAIWWLGHFVVAAICGHMAATHLNGVNNAGLIAIPIVLAITMAFLFAANLYLMLAIAVGIPRPRIWLIVWKYRFVVDLMVTAVTIAAT